MNHKLSIETKAAEQYLMGELLPRDRDAFEQHFFECSECAASVCAGSMLAQCAKAYFENAPSETVAPVRGTRRWLSWFTLPIRVPLAATFALLSLTVYQNTELRRVAAESAIPRVLVFAGLVPAARSAPQSILVPSNAPFFQLALELPPGDGSSTYSCEMSNDAGRSLWKLQACGPATSDGLGLLVPTAQLKEGTYNIIVRGKDLRDAPALASFRFNFTRQ